ncbi:4245_t:CDS:1 [Paraglomus occultum]|uniref:4245_t:CDS:1 n=1 Tax=Paraglomus occultum TaxID=144539 RepID=A0A9N8ZFL3_9GLOM|nr:4245_t:CDS:1 [Paraglomus occultum]
MDGTKLKQIQRLREFLFKLFVCPSTTYKQFDILRRLFNSVNNNPSHTIFTEGKFDDVFVWLKTLDDNSKIWHELEELSEPPQSNVIIDPGSKPSTLESPQTLQPSRRGKRNSRKKITRKPYSRPKKQSSDSNAALSSYGKDLPEEVKHLFQVFPLEKNNGDGNTHAPPMSIGTRASTTETEGLPIPNTTSTTSDNFASTTISGLPVCEPPRRLSAHTPERASTTSSNCTIVGLPLDGSASSMLTFGGECTSNVINHYCESPRSMSFSSEEPITSNVQSSNGFYAQRCSDFVPNGSSEW